MDEAEEDLCGQTSDDVITFFYIVYVSPNGFDDACAFMAQNGRKLIRVGTIQKV